MKFLSTMIISMILLTGCGSDVYVDDKLYLRGAAVDGSKVTFAFFSEEDGVISVEGETISDAKNAAELELGKEIFTGHTELVILSGCDREKALEYMLHDWKVPPSCRVWGTDKSGEDILRQRRVEELVGIIDMEQKKGLLGRCDIITTLKNCLINE